jgi:YD repeat-containing protein
MSEYGAGRTRVLPIRVPPGSTEEIVPEFAAGEVGQVTHTRFITGPPGQDGNAQVDGSVTLAYDVDGKLITLTRVSGVTTLAYDVDDLLTTVTEPDQTKTLSYDVDDRLISVTIS